MSHWRWLWRCALRLRVRSSGEYWERRYRAGLTSGPGSYGELAAFKAEILNSFVQTHSVASVVEFGCGDGRQLALARYPAYLGLDVSRAAIEACIARFRDDATKSFLWYDPLRTANLASFVSGELTLSLDVVYHLLEDEIYARYLRDLFSTSRRYVIVYSSDREGSNPAAHVRHREFTRDVRRDMPEFRLVRRLENRYPDRSFSDFFVFERLAPVAR